MRKQSFKDGDMLRTTIGVLVLTSAIVLAYASQQINQIVFFASEHDTVCQADVIVVMGAAQYNGRPSPAFQKRLDKALTLYQLGCAETIVVTGGKQEADWTTEGAVGANYLHAQGVGRRHLRIESQSRSSYENLANSLPYLNKRKVIIVTDDLHAYRSFVLSKRLGLDAEVSTVPVSFNRWAYAFRELQILVAYRVGMGPS